MNNQQSLDDILKLPDTSSGDVVIVNRYDELDSPENITRQLQRGPQPNQLWLAREGDDMMYVMITSVLDDPRMVQVIPLDNDERHQTSDSMVILSGSPLRTLMVAWPHFEATIPVRLLLKPLQSFPANVANAVRTAQELSDAKGELVKRGTDPADPDDEAFSLRYDMFFTLVGWHALCMTLPQLGASGDSRYVNDSDRRAYAQALQTVLGLTPFVSLKVMRGEAALDDSQRERMAEAGFATQPHKKVAIPDDYLIQVEQPRFRSVIYRLDQKRAQRVNPDAEQQTDETERTDESTRMLLAREAFALAARRKGHGPEAVNGALEEAARELLSETPQ